MKVAERTIGAIQKAITGDALKDKSAIAPYQSGPQLVEFFNEIGFNETYAWGGGFPSRWAYCEEKLRELNDTDGMARAIEADDVLRPIVTGLTSVVSGLAATRNKMSDAHARTYKPERHHARLAVNAANTLTDFLLDSYAYRKTKDIGVAAKGGE